MDGRTGAVEALSQQLPAQGLAAFRVAHDTDGPEAGAGRNRLDAGQVGGIEKEDPAFFQGDPVQECGHVWIGVESRRRGDCGGREVGGGGCRFRSEAKDGPGAGHGEDSVIGGEQAGHGAFHLEFGERFGLGGRIREAEDAPLATDEQVMSGPHEAGCLEVFTGPGARQAPFLFGDGFHFPGFAIFDLAFEGNQFQVGQSKGLQILPREVEHGVGQNRLKIASPGDGGTPGLQVVEGGGETAPIQPVRRVGGDIAAALQFAVDSAADAVPRGAAEMKVHQRAVVALQDGGHGAPIRNDEELVRAGQGTLRRDAAERTRPAVRLIEVEISQVLLAPAPLARFHVDSLKHRSHEGPDAGPDIDQTAVDDGTAASTPGGYQAAIAEDATAIQAQAQAPLQGAVVQGKGVAETVVTDGDDVIALDGGGEPHGGVGYGLPKLFSRAGIIGSNRVDTIGADDEYVAGDDGFVDLVEGHAILVDGIFPAGLRRRQVAYPPEMQFVGQSRRGAAASAGIMLPHGPIGGEDGLSQNYNTQGEDARHECTPLLCLQPATG